MKKNILVILSILITIMLAGCQDKASNSEIKSEQKRMAEYTVKNYEDVKKIEFLNFSQNTSTRMWSADAVVNDKIYITFTISKISTDDKIGVGQHTSESKGEQLKKKKEKDKNTIDIENVEIIYHEVKK
ncbi:hypothetical protein [Gemella morbillorum]|uniref:hypothetical protein n=1 Tax=Gemella morbillorum TaxID=29391 RepID=UPI003566F650